MFLTTPTRQTHTPKAVPEDMHIPRAYTAALPRSNPQTLEQV